MPRHVLPPPHTIPALSTVPSHYHSLDLDAMHERISSLHYPCRHAVAGCTAASIEWVPYVNPIYRQEAVFKVYEMEFPPIPNESLWSEWHGTMMCPNLTMRQKATRRPVSTRFRNDMDDVEHQEKRCALCRQVGHTRRGCPNQPTGDA
ncbi:hypothetical protein Ahy_A06g029621 [Arachis hypogaea]|uniref:CCHC-type domain-containing protein n=1 Tax=Arachis hypogaea TaxID=3818 RepID=A0A445CTY7_ARAHY|nr:hypothetical protein Ahy_A06g029621 [Arachis hypogaea]